MMCFHRYTLMGRPKPSIRYEIPLAIARARGAIYDWGQLPATVEELEQDKKVVNQEQNTPATVGCVAIRHDDPLRVSCYWLGREAVPIALAP